VGEKHSTVLSVSAPKEVCPDLVFLLNELRRHVDCGYRGCMSRTVGTRAYLRPVIHCNKICIIYVLPYCTPASLILGLIAVQCLEYLVLPKPLVFRSKVPTQECKNGDCTKDYDGEIERFSIHGEFERGYIDRKY